MNGAIRTRATIDTSCLRAQASLCVKLARDCPDAATSRQLEGIGVELMLKAEELDGLIGDWTNTR